MYQHTNQKLFPRKVIPRLLQHSQDKRAIMLVGPHRSGKSSVMHQLIRELLNSGVNEQQIFYFDLSDLMTLSAFESGVIEFFAFLESNGLESNGEYFLFIDGIEYLIESAYFMKLIVDRYKNIKLFFTGTPASNTIAKLEKYLKEKIVITELAPLDFEEFLIFKEKNRLASLVADGSIRKWSSSSQIEDTPFRFFMQSLNRYFNEFAVFGGYPEVVLEVDREKKIKHLVDIYRDYVQVGIKDLVKTANIPIYKKLCKILALQITDLVNQLDLSMQLGTARNTTERYLSLLENTRWVKFTTPIFSDKKKEIVKSRQVFYMDNGIRNIIINNFDALDSRVDKVHLVNNFVFSNLIKNSSDFHLHFWRTKGGNQVEFILKNEELIPVQVDYKLYVDPKIPKGLRSFARRFETRQQFVLTENYFGSLNQDGFQIIFLPVWLA